ncbi:MAG TPA: putative phage abortive infection protein [Mucilaginibacter sp.]|nr:putative phage abortive infection protein [Mucilaginibacter sp.]
MSLAQNNIWHNEQNLQIQRIEDRFFVFLSIHRENVASMTFRGEVIGKRFFIEAFDKFQKVYQISIEVNEYLIRKNLVKKLSEIDLIELSYKVIFFGCTGSNSLRVLSSSLISFDKYVIHPDKEMNFVSIFIHELTIKGVNEQGLQSNLGNYFRHLFHTVTYINDLQVLQDTDKQFYIKRLRGQFSNHEIAMLFVNCFSIGKRWTAYSHDNSKDTEDLITKYELIRNLPSDFFNDFDFRCYFPDIHYEGHLYIFRDDPAYRKC